MYISYGKNISQLIRMLGITGMLLILRYFPESGGSK